MRQSQAGAADIDPDRVAQAHRLGLQAPAQQRGQRAQRDTAGIDGQLGYPQTHEPAQLGCAGHLDGHGHNSGSVLAVAAYVGGHPRA